MQWSCCSCRPPMVWSDSYHEEVNLVKRKLSSTSTTYRSESKSPEPPPPGEARTVLTYDGGIIRPIPPLFFSLGFTFLSPHPHIHNERETSMLVCGKPYQSIVNMVKLFLYGQRSAFMLVLSHHAPEHLASGKL